MEEKKTYSIIGQVTIGTDEYRDLVEDNAATHAKYDDACSERWQLRTKVEKLEKTVAKYNEFIQSSPEISAAYTRWLIGEEEQK